MRLSICHSRSCGVVRKRSLSCPSVCGQKHLAMMMVKAIPTVDHIYKADILMKRVKSVIPMHSVSLYEVYFFHTSGSTHRQITIYRYCTRFVCDFALARREAWSWPDSECGYRNLTLIQTLCNKFGSSQIINTRKYDGELDSVRHRLTRWKFMELHPPYFGGIACLSFR